MRFSPSAAPRTAPLPLRALRPETGDLSRVTRLAVPITVAQVGMVLMGVVDTAMVGRLSPVALAATALGNLYFVLMTSFGMGVLLALDPILSQAVGAGDRGGFQRGVQRGIVLALLLALGVWFASISAETVFVLTRQPAEVIPQALAYLRSALPGALPFFLFIVFRQALQVRGRMRPIVVTVMVANLLNAGFNWVFVFGNLGFPAYGVVGAGWTSTLSRGVLAIGLLVAGWPLLKPALLPLTRESLSLSPLVRILALGVPIGIQIALEFGSFAAAGLLMGMLGTVVMAAHQVAFSLASLAFMVPLGVAQASSILVGRAVGEGDRRSPRRLAGASILLGGGTMMISAILYLFFPELPARLYTTDREVLALAVILIPVAGLFQVVDGVQVVCAGALRGTGDTRGPMLLNLIGLWGIGMPTALLLVFHFKVGPAGVWLGLAVGLAAVAWLLLRRLRHRFSGELRRLEIEGSSGFTPLSDVPDGPPDPGEVGPVAESPSAR